MDNSSSSSPKYKFGVELEMYIDFKRMYQDVTEDRTMKSKLEKAADQIARLYNHAILELPPPGQPRIGGPRMIRSFQVRNSGTVVNLPRSRETANLWQIHDEPSLYMFGLEQCDGWPLEFASPVFGHSIMMAPNFTVLDRWRYHAPWVTSIKTLFEVLENETTVLVNDECALQVSVSANDSYGWDSLDQVKSLSKSILYFERAIRPFLPQHRRDNDYAKWIGSPTQVTSTTTHMNPQFQGASDIESRIALVDACITVKDLVMLMNNRHKRWAWNFTGLQANPRSKLIHGRVEFRSPPGVDNWSECVSWIHFTVEFIHAAISTNATNATMHRLGEFESDWEGLMKFLDSAPPLLTRGLKATYRRELGLPDHWIPDNEPIL